tara:strand:- start:790 stop:1494 length:705 start_codon:yes stop_codon:yes gene_type:complete
MELEDIKKIAAFDFDDTLAKTNSLIGVRFSNASLSFEDFLSKNSVKFVEHRLGFWWLNSANYALLEDLEIPLDTDIEADYAQTMRIDISTIEVIHPMLAKMKLAIEDPDTLTLLVTARAGSAKTYSPSMGKEIKSTNRKQIASFLNDNGLKIPDVHIHTVGDNGVDTSKKKAEVLKGYLAKYKPEELTFYDDSDRNIRQVALLCNDASHRTKIFAYKVKNGKIIEKQGCDHKKG